MVGPEDQQEGDAMQPEEAAELKPVRTIMQSTPYFPRAEAGMTLPIVHLLLGKGGDTSKLLQRVTEKRAHEDVSKAWGIKGDEAEAADLDASMQSVLSVQPLDTTGMHLPDPGTDTTVKTELSEDMTQRCKAQIEGKPIQSRQEAKRRLEAKDITFINLC